ncbi:spore gernimation protein [Bacillus coahuilensis m2-6]|uniref:Spore gernimation protein n=1 Tax=Bacillus coahuilensis p1.1.43 TaxID=1150625 RepID=A0A147KAL7_9BACI|nr:spore germination protein GerPB [Bacillus coahuilensis]KUP07747.1 spore gernimation protein [Bacillus coahuilensis p1.1.43]KUP09041.1 spore gernimation protein [Bacillus coahuilensis m2-6]
MNIYVQQSITIHSIKIGGISNSSVFQIGTSGNIIPASYLFNTGGFIKPAPEPEKNGTSTPLEPPIFVPISPK